MSSLRLMRTKSLKTWSQNNCLQVWSDFHFRYRGFSASTVAAIWHWTHRINNSSDKRRRSRTRICILVWCNPLNCPLMRRKALNLCWLIPAGHLLLSLWFIFWGCSMFQVIMSSSSAGCFYSPHCDIFLWTARLFHCVVFVLVRCLLFVLVDFCLVSLFNFTSSPSGLKMLKEK